MKFSNVPYVLGSAFVWRLGIEIVVEFCIDGVIILGKSISRFRDIYLCTNAWFRKLRSYDTLPKSLSIPIHTPRMSSVCTNSHIRDIGIGSR